MPTTRATRQKCNCSHNNNNSQSNSNNNNNSRPCRKYTCPICLDYLLPPVFQCVNGHLICDNCHVKVKICPQCREPYVGKRIRNIAVEEIVRESSYECKNIDAGCSLILKFDQVRDHELDCKFSNLNFCECLGLNCEEKIGEGGIVEHLKSVHRARGIETSPSASEILVDLTQSLPKIELERWSVLMGNPHYFLFDGKVFFLKTMVDVKEKCISWMVCIAGSQKSGMKYEAKVRYFSNAPPVLRNSMEWQGGIYSFDKKFGDVSTLSVPFKSLGQASDSRSSRRPEYHIKTRISIQIPNGPVVQQSLGNIQNLSSDMLPLNPTRNIGGNIVSSNDAAPPRRSIFDGVRVILNSSSSSDSSSDSDDARTIFGGVDGAGHSSQGAFVSRRVRGGPSGNTTRPAPYSLERAGLVHANPRRSTISDALLS